MAPSNRANTAKNPDSCAMALASCAESLMRSASGLMFDTGMLPSTSTIARRSDWDSTLGSPATRKFSSFA